MNFNLRSIRFKTWLYFTLFAIAVLVLLYVLQTSFIVPYYQNQKTVQADGIIDAIAETINDSKDINSIGSVAYNNMACVVIINNDGEKIYERDYIGDSCVLNKTNANFDIWTNYQVLQGEEKSVVREFINFSEQIRSGLVVGKKINANLFTYYIFVHVLIVPVSSTINILRNMFIVASLVVVAIAFLISWFFSYRIAQPIMTMKTGADQLALGNYKTKFSGKGYLEAESLANALNIATGRLSKLDEMRSELFSNVSHDLKTPLTNILLYGELLEEGEKLPLESKQEYLSVIQREANYLNALVNDMNMISEAQDVINKEVFDLSQLVLDILDTISIANTDENLRFESYIEEKVLVDADPIKIEQTIRNFVLNAIIIIITEKMFK